MSNLFGALLVGAFAPAIAAAYIHYKQQQRPDQMNAAQPRAEFVLFNTSPSHEVNLADDRRNKLKAVNLSQEISDMFARLKEDRQVSESTLIDGHVMFDCIEYQLNKPSTEQANKIIAAFDAGECRGKVPVLCVSTLVRDALFDMFNGRPGEMQLAQWMGVHNVYPRVACIVSYSGTESSLIEREGRTIKSVRASSWVTPRWTRNPELPTFRFPDAPDPLVEHRAVVDKYTDAVLHHVLISFGYPKDTIKTLDREALVDTVTKQFALHTVVALTEIMGFARDAQKAHAEADAKAALAKAEEATDAALAQADAALAQAEAAEAALAQAEAALAQTEADSVKTETDTETETLPEPNPKRARAADAGVEVDAEVLTGMAEDKTATDENAKPTEASDAPTVVA